MKDQLIIALGRQNGSGGHELAATLATTLGIELYDTNTFRKVIEENGYSYKDINAWDEKRIRLLSGKRQDNFNTPLEQTVATLTFEFLRKQADAGKSFVVVGRAADYLLKDNPNLVSVFVNGSEEARATRMVEKYQMSKKDALKEIKAVDTQRRKYHDFYAKTGWGNADSYNLCLDSSYLSMDKMAEVVIAYAKVKVPSAF